jgi:hypothetical protein
MGLLYVYLYVRVASYLSGTPFTRSSLYFAGALYTHTGRDSSVGIATGYGLDGQGIESWWGRDFSPRPERP